MSRIAALFWSIALVVITFIVTAGLLTGAGLAVLDSKTGDVLRLTERGLESVPELVGKVGELVKGLPPALAEPFNVRRAPQYAGNLEIKAQLLPPEEGGYWRPAITITNQGDRVVGVLAVRVVAVDEQQRPVAEWNEVVATPLALGDDDWRGPLLPQVTRQVLASGCWSPHRSLQIAQMDKMTAVVEVADVMLCEPLPVQTSIASTKTTD
ncbi:MAG TPA: hypothetical protein PKK06_11055 [Phycisphaerae bacterium]|nr:hypothetical protein [Phycisphaerae bacterium]HNU44354.1 hypothetical protein [Phycisphaerae bacterium]